MRMPFAARVAKRFNHLYSYRPAKLSFLGGIASVTFDDFPRSALAIGGAILEKYKSRGTYYTSASLAATTGDLGQMFDLDEIRAAHLMGHEIACHTYSHLDCGRAGVDKIVADVSENAKVLSPVLTGTGMTNFAFPYGASTLAARRALSNHFVSCRGITHGINHGICDLSDLRAVRIYNRRIDESALARLIDHCRSVGGWIIFYTHDVSDTGAPSEYGCTSDQLETIVSCAATAMPVMPVRDVLARAGYTRLEVSSQSGRPGSRTTEVDPDRETAGAVF